jgi:hypothetical protein
MNWYIYILIYYLICSYCTYSSHVFHTLTVVPCPPCPKTLLGSPVFFGVIQGPAAPTGTHGDGGGIPCLPFLGAPQMAKIWMVYNGKSIYKWMFFWGNLHMVVVIMFMCIMLCIPNFANFSVNASWFSLWNMPSRGYTRLFQTCPINYQTNVAL